MKRYISLIAAFIVMSAATSSAQTLGDTLRTQTRLADLTLQRNQLRQHITVEDKNRNRQLPGVAPEQMELINLRQDSLCLELRSRLTEVELELAELTATSLPGITGTAHPAPQGSPALQQIMQSLRQNRPEKKDE